MIPAVAEDSDRDVWDSVSGGAIGYARWGIRL